MPDDFEDDDEAERHREIAERYGWKEGEREAAYAEVEQRHRQIEGERILAEAWAAREAREAKAPPSNLSSPVVTKSYAPAPAPIPDTNDAIRRAQQAIDALRRSKPGTAAEAGRRAGELVRAQSELTAAAQRVTQRVTQPEAAAAAPADPHWDAWRKFILATVRKKFVSDEMLGKVVKQLGEQITDWDEEVCRVTREKREEALAPLRAEIATLRATVEELRERLDAAPATRTLKVA